VWARLMPTRALTPESMWLMRWASGCSTDTTTPRDLREFLAELLEHLLAGPAGLRVEAHDDFRGVDLLGMLVQLGPARPPAEVGHATNPSDSIVHQRGDGARRIE